MKKQQLKGWKHILKEIDLIEKEYEKLNLKIESDTYQSKTEKIRSKLLNRIEILQNRLIELECWLDTIKDDQIRLILRMVYVNGMKHKDVAKELGCTRASISKKIERFFGE